MTSIKKADEEGSSCHELEGKQECNELSTKSPLDFACIRVREITGCIKVPKHRMLHCVTRALRTPFFTFLGSFPVLL